MDRRIFLAASASTLLTQISSLAQAQTLPNKKRTSLGTKDLNQPAAFTGLKKSPRMPVLFVGHGSPMNAITDNEYRRSWEDLGDKFGPHNTNGSYPKPQLILCISAHWITENTGWFLTGMDKPKTIHDFGGFPKELFDQEYPAPGAPQTAQAIAQSMSQGVSSYTPKIEPISLDTKDWGYDHGTWSVLKPMFPKADIPVIQLSMDYARAPEDHYRVGQELQKLRDYGVLIVGSGNVVHNLRLAQRGVGPQQMYPWAHEFDSRVKQYIINGDTQSLVNFQKMGQIAQLSQPTWDHYLPFIYTLGAIDKKDKLEFFNESFQSASISMRSMIWSPNKA